MQIAGRASGAEKTRDEKNGARHILLIAIGGHDHFRQREKNEVKENSARRRRAKFFSFALISFLFKSQRARESGPEDKR
jgi:hypothetical protein